MRGRLVDMRVIKNFLKLLNEKRIILSIYINEKRNIKKKKNLVNKVSLTKEQIKEIDELWKKNYGKKISKKWHRLYTSYMGVFNKEYFPEIMFFTNLLHKFNPIIRKKYLADKILITHLFENVNENKFRTVKNIIYNCSGIMYDEKRNYKL